MSDTMVMEEQESDMELAAENLPVPVPQIQESKSSTIKRSNKTGASRGKPRLRKKALHASILKQMEFYFSDANLRNDRYLTNLIKKNSYVDLQEFIKFNKLSELTMDTNRIAKALQRSTMLKVSEDGAKVCRLTEIKEKTNTDECTIYVQNLPADADHDWLTSIFSKYGSVVYVSIPRYKSNRKIKGFAFVEFDTPKDAEKCIKIFQEKGCVLPSHTSPDNLLSITTFDDATKDLTIREQTGQGKNSKATTAPPIHENAEKKASKNTGEGIIAKEDLTSTDNTDIKMKRKKTANENIMEQQSDTEGNAENQGNATNKDLVSRNKVTDTGRRKKKRAAISDTFIADDIGEEAMKTDSCRSQVTRTDKNGVTGSKSLKKNNDDAEKNVTSQTDKHVGNENVEEINSDNEEITIDISGKKRKRNRNRRSKIEQNVCNVIGLQVMAKRDWKHLRNKYLDLQKSKMKQLKQHLTKARWNYDKTGSICDKSKYEKDNDNIDEINEKSSYGRISYAPGIIVKIEMDEPCSDVRSFKTEIKDNNCVKYVDVMPGACEAYIRCDTTEAAQSFAQNSYEGRRLTILGGDEERLYWDKIEQDREEKLNRKERVKHRGRNKLLKRAEKKLGKCIKFDEV